MFELLSSCWFVGFGGRVFDKFNWLWPFDLSTKGVLRGRLGDFGMGVLRRRSGDLELEVQDA